MWSDARTIDRMLIAPDQVSDHRATSTWSSSVREALRWRRVKLLACIYVALSKGYET
jgi:hypothetical protein